MLVRRIFLIILFDQIRRCGHERYCRHDVPPLGVGSIIKFIKKIAGLEGAEPRFFLYAFRWKEGLPLGRTTKFVKKRRGFSS
jgi:hypothetical protein